MGTPDFRDRDVRLYGDIREVNAHERRVVEREPMDAPEIRLLSPERSSATDWAKSTIKYGCPSLPRICFAQGMQTCISFIAELMAEVSARDISYALDM